MTRKTTFTVAAVVELLGAAHGLGGIIVSSIVLFAIWLVVLRSHPQRACPGCGGQGRFYHRLFGWRFARCTSCVGTGREYARGLGVFGKPAQRAQVRQRRRDRDSFTG